MKYRHGNLLSDPKMIVENFKRFKEYFDNLLNDSAEEQNISYRLTVPVHIKTSVPNGRTRIT